MNVGDPNRLCRRAGAEGVGYAHSSEDPRKGKSGKSEGALLKLKFQMNRCRPIEEGKYSTASRNTAYSNSQKAEGDEQCGKSTAISEETIP